ncbi:PepSY domain-containing protein [Kineosporia sp. A_224]|uniref:PepSY domain-containing protein n=1 Tax=Kineosporia sp. A_224 TaxID=1962180 RepID=UPI000B4B72A6|nr:PepSY domain-containing protein [Kineosporia sp. A_224]
MTRTSIASFAVGALAVGLVASGTAYAVMGPGDTRVVAPVSVNAADTGPTDDSTGDPSAGPSTDPSTDPSTVPSTDPGSQPSVDDNGHSTDDDSTSGHGDDGSQAVAVPAGVTLDRARTIALGVKAGTVREAKLDDKNGRTVWDVEITGTDGAKWEVTLDAMSGDVLKTERD